MTGFDPASVADRAALRAELGYRPDEKICVVCVGGSGIGSALLRRLIEAYPDARRLVPGLRMVVVAGPRIDLNALPSAPGVELHPYLDGLYRHLAASDLAVVQGGLATCMELAATRRPFLYFPLKGHFEQSLHVHHRLRRHDAGRRLDFDTVTAGEIALAIAEEICRDVDYLPVADNAAQRAAALIADLI